MNFDLPEATAVLERTPAALRALLSGLPPSWIESTEGPGTWSPYDVLGHLIHGERTDWVPRAEIILAQGTNPRFVPFDRYAQFDEAQKRPLGALLDEFGEVRAKGLATLKAWNLSDAQLGLTGTHPELGVVTLQQLLATWVAHDLGHIAQIVRVMAKRYQTDVGPWTAYLSIMTR